MSLKTKYIEVKDTEKRQITMEVESEKEAILYCESFETETNTNNEFVVGLPLELLEITDFNYAKLAADYKQAYAQLSGNEHIGLSIHSKKQETEIHFHINFEGTINQVEEIRELFTKLNTELVASL